jgi:putative DNA primase/helicase
MNALRSMAQALGGDVAGAAVICPGPGHSPRDRSLSVTLSLAAPDGFIVHSHAGDDWRECPDHVLNRLGRPAERRVASVRTQKPVERRSASVALWKVAVDPGDTVVERYLSQRGLKLPNDVAGRVVRFHPSCPWGEGIRHPAMITAFRSIADDSLQAIHRTALTPEGQKIGRKMLGPVGGAAIKIDADENIEQGLSICEGFETGLAGRVLGFGPVWALGSAGAIEVFPLLSGIDALTMLAETDDSGANANAVRICGKRWARADREVIVATPRVRGDMNDAVRT